MGTLLRVDGELFEFCGCTGGAFPFKVSEVSRKKTSVIRLGVDEFKWLARELVRFYSAKGDPLWVRTFKMGNGCFLLQLRKNT